MKTYEERLSIIYGWLADNLDLPCKHNFDDERGIDFMHKQSDWCDKKCGIVTEEKCWEKYFDLKYIRKDGRP